MIKKRRVNLTPKEFNKKLKFVKEFYTIKHEDPKPNLQNYAYIVDKISKIELTFKDCGKAITYVCDKAESAYVHEKQGIEAYSTLQKYHKTPHVSNKEDALFSFAGILYSNPKYDGKRQFAYGYDLNSAFNYAMLQPMPKDTEKGPINFNKKFNMAVPRIVKKGEIGYCEGLGINGENRWKICLEGECATYIFKTEESPYKRFVEVWYEKKKNAKTMKEKIAAKDMLVMCVGFMQRHNFWMRGAIIGYSNRLIEDIIKKYPDNILISNTDSIISNIRIKELEDKLGKEIGQWKFEKQGEFAYIKSNYQWDYEIPTFRGIPKSWFTDGWDILKDPLPINNNRYEYNSNLIKLERRRNEKI